MVYMEEWRDVCSYEGYYQVSNKGRVKSLDRTVSHSYENGRRVLKERVLSISVNSKGYLCVMFSKNGKTKPMRIHRMVAQAFIPNPNNLPEVNHKDEDKTNNNVENLEWCTHLYNIRWGTGSVRAGLSRLGQKHTYGESTGTSKLKEFQVIEIFKSNKKYTELMAEYNIGISAISNIKNKKTWIHLLANL